MPKRTVRTVPLRFCIDFPEGSQSIIADPSSVLARPYRRLMQEGTEPGSISYLAVQDPSGVLYVLGVLCETVGDRLVFFPGIPCPIVEGFFSADGIECPIDRDVDHLTFEMKRRAAHFTRVTEAGNRQTIAGPPQRRHEVAPGVLAWFGLTARSLDRLELLPSKVWIVGECPATDVARRTTSLQQSSRAVVMPIPFPARGFFAHVNFYVDFNPGRALTRIATLLPPPSAVSRSVPVGSVFAQTLYHLPVFGSAFSVTIDWHLPQGDPVRNFLICT